MGKNLTRREIITTISHATGYPYRRVAKVVRSTLDLITDELADAGHVELRNFGTFEVQKRSARVGRNPFKPEKDIMIPERATAKFKAGRALKSKLRKIDLEKLR